MRIKNQHTGHVGDSLTPQLVPTVERVENGLSGTVTIVGNVTPPWTGSAHVNVEGGDPLHVRSATFDHLGRFTIETDGRLHNGDRVLVGFGGAWTEFQVTEN